MVELTLVVITIADDLSQSVDYNYGINPKGDYIQTDGKSSYSL